MPRFSRMRHLTAGSKSALVGDTTAELLVRYATLLSRQRTADSIDINGYDTTGATTVLTLLINEGLSLVAEQVVTDLPEPDNDAADRYLRSEIEAQLRHQNPSYDDIAGTRIWNQQ